MSKHSERLESEEVYFVPSDDDDDDDDANGSGNNSYSNTTTQSKVTSSIIRNNDVTCEMNKNVNFYSNRVESPRETLSSPRIQSADDILFGDVFALQKRRMMANANKSTITTNNNYNVNGTSEAQEIKQTSPNTETTVKTVSSSPLEIKQT